MVLTCLALNVLQSPRFAHVFPTMLTLAPDDDSGVQEYFGTMDRSPNNQAEEVFARREFEKTVNILNQVDCRQLYARKNVH